MRTGCAATLSCRPTRSLQSGPQPKLPTVAGAALSLNSKPYTRTNVGFFEAMLQGNTAAEAEPTQPLDPILVELREMRKELIPLIRSATFWFFLALGVLAFFLVWRLSGSWVLSGGIPIRCQFADHPAKGTSLVITCLSN